MSALSPPVESYNGGQRSPRHYDKYTYAAKRRPEAEAEEYKPVSPRSQRRRREALTEYEAVVAGLAPLHPSFDGFCVAEDGSVSSRFVSPVRHGAPAVAMVGVPVAVIPMRSSEGAGGEGGEGGGGNAGGVPGVGYLNFASRGGVTGGALRFAPEQSALSMAEMGAWLKLTALAARDFDERELVEMSWDVLERLLTHYGIRGAVDVARVQLAWKHKRAAAPTCEIASCSPPPAPSSPSPGSPANVGECYIPAAFARTNSANTPSNIHFTAGAAASPRHSPGSRFVPRHRQRLDFSHVVPKVDTGLHHRGSGTPRGRGGGDATPKRAATPTRAAASVARSPMRY